VVLEGNKQQVGSIQSKRSNNTLHLASGKSSANSNELVKLYIKMPVLKEVSVYGNAYVKSIGLKAKNLELKLNTYYSSDIDEMLSAYLETDDYGGGKIDMDVTADELRLSIRGNGEACLTGKAGRTDFTINGSGRIDASELMQEKCDAEIYGKGQLLLNVLDYVDAEIIGSGQLLYTGDPEIELTSIGSGKIKRIKD
jgi:hypothetical protein